VVRLTISSTSAGPYAKVDFFLPPGMVTELHGRGFSYWLRNINDVFLANKHSSIN